LLDKPELEVKGIDMVRSSFPLAFRKFMDTFLRKLLTQVPKNELDDLILKLQEEVKTLPVLEIAKNTSVKFVSQDGVHNYNPDNRKPFHFEKGTPAQAKAALAYNDLLIKLGLETINEPILHGQKIKYIYLKPNPYGLDGMALKGDDTDPDEMLSFVNQYVDRNEMFQSELKSKFTNDKGLGIYDVLQWNFPNPSVKTASSFFAFE
jgi:hypothetical protein